MAPHYGVRSEMRKCIALPTTSRNLTEQCCEVGKVFNPSQVCFGCMPKHTGIKKGQTRAPKDPPAILRGTVTIALGALSLGGAVKAGSPFNAITTDYRMTKAQALAICTALTDGEGDGLILLLVDNDLSAGEIAEAMNADGPLNGSDRILSERASRPVWEVGMTEFGDKTATNTKVFKNLDTGGIRCAVSPNWKFRDGKGFDWAIYNSGTTITTGASTRIVSKFHGRWD